MQYNVLTNIYIYIYIYIYILFILEAWGFTPVQGEQ